MKKIRVEFEFRYTGYYDIFDIELPVDTKQLMLDIHDLIYTSMADEEDIAHAVNDTLDNLVWFYESGLETATVNIRYLEDEDAEITFSIEEDAE